MSSRHLVSWVLIGALACGGVHAADKPTSGQRTAAEEFLAAAASGDAQSVAFAIHPAELETLRLRILAQLRDEATRQDNTIRARLFGAGMQLADLEKMTSVAFYTALARKLYLRGRRYQSVEGVAAIPDRDGAVLVVVRGKPARERGAVTVVVPEIVLEKPYGKDWKAAVPAEIEAQIEDLIRGRGNAAAAAPRLPAVENSKATPTEQGVPPSITQLLTDAEKALTDGKCDEYYQKHMSPNFRRVTSAKAREALIASCRKPSGSKEMLLSTLRIARGLVPKFEYQGARATYDLSGQGLPYDRFALEQVEKRWYIAE